MRTYGLLGKKLDHSFSKDFFSKKFKKEHIINTKYVNIQLDNLLNIHQVIKDLNISGFNVTLPYKQEIIPYLYKIDAQAEIVGSVNVVKIVDNKLYGFNTDIIGFEKSIFPLIKYRKTALILGNGGVSKSVQYVFSKLNISFKVVNRNTIFDYSDINQEIINSSDIIVNCTPIGSFPRIDTSPSIPYENITSKHLLFDLIYNPELTKFLSHGLQKDAIIKNGKEMLYIQAEESWTIWNSDNI